MDLGTTLYAITNSQLSGNETEQDWQQLLKKLQALDLPRAETWQYGNTYKEDEGEWEYELNPFGADDTFGCAVCFNGPFKFMIYLYPNAAVISTIHRYWILQKIELIWDEWFADFRKDLYSVVQALGGTEVIYLPDNNRQPLCSYLDMIEDGVAYLEVKQQLIKDLEPPVTDYMKFGAAAKEQERFMLDDFADLIGK